MKTMIKTLLVTASLSLAGLAVENDAPAEPNLAISASHVLVEGGVVLEDAMVLVGDGHILAVGKAADLEGNLPAGVQVVEHEGWLSAGLVAAHSTLGLTASSDSTSAFMPDLALIHGFDPNSKALTAARALGVTTLGVEASRANVFGGTGAVVKTDGSVVRKRANLAVSLVPPAIRGNRFPTSFGGGMRAVRERFEAAEQGALADAKSGKLRTSFAINGPADIDRALTLTNEFGLRSVLRGGDEHTEFAAELKEAGIGVALGPLSLSSNERTYASIKQLAKAGVPLAFGFADNGNVPATLRESAALAARGGLDRATAWNAVTKTAAELTGAGDRVGRVATGLDADLVLWSGDPLLIASKPVAVYIGGAKTQGDSH